MATCRFSGFYKVPSTTAVLFPASQSTPPTCRSSNNAISSRHSSFSLKSLFTARLRVSSRHGGTCDIFQWDWLFCLDGEQTNESHYSVQTSRCFFSRWGLITTDSFQLGIFGHCLLRLTRKRLVWSLVSIDSTLLRTPQFQQKKGEKTSGETRTRRRFLSPPFSRILGQIPLV